MVDKHISSSSDEVTQREVWKIALFSQPSDATDESEIEEITKEGSTDFHTVKGILTSLYGYELMEIVASAEVTKRKGGF